MSKRKVNFITTISALLMIIGVVIACMKVEIVIWCPFVIVPMALIRFMLYKLKKEKENKY